MAVQPCMELMPIKKTENKMKQNHMGKVGRKPVLTVIEEDVFTTGVEHICSWGFP